MRKIVFISTTNVTINSFLLDIIHKLKKNNKIFILTNFNDNKKKIEGIEYVHINFQRKIHIVKDLISLVFLIKNIFFIKPDLIYTITPKAGFLGIISSFLLRVKTRIHIFTGQVWITKFGIIREILKIVDKIILKLSTNCLIDSHAQKKFLIESKIFNKFNLNKIRVLGDGSICGVDTSKFKPNMLSRGEIRAKYNIPQNDKIIIFVGRLNVDRGVLDLVEAYNKICLNNKINDTHLLIVGDDEENLINKISFKYKKIIKKIHFIGYVENTEEYLSASDIFCLPSYREGFGISILEAGSTGLPVITSNIYGLQDTVDPGITGLFNEVGNIEEMVKNITYLLENPKLRSQMGLNARKRIKLKFEKEKIINLYYKFILELLLSNSKKNIAIVSSTQLSIEVFFINQIKKLSKKYNITIYTKYEDESLFLKLENFYNINFQNINIKRNIIIANDIYIFTQLFFYFLFNRYNALFTITPKAGALAQFTGFLTLIDKRIHWFGGQVWFTMSGFKKYFLKIIDKLIYLSCTSCLTECISQKKFLEEQNIVKKNSLVIIGNGSICGVDTSKFIPNLEHKTSIRKNLQINQDKCLLLFVGRLTYEKGIYDLSKAVEEIIQENQNINIHLMFVGPDEEHVKQNFFLKFKKLKNFVTFVDFTHNPERYMAASDIFCLPSHREGFGMAALEAASSSLPVINSNIYGLSDAVEDNITGLSFEVKNITSLKDKLKKLIYDKSLRLKLGHAGRLRAKSKFEQEDVVNNISKYFENLI